MTDLEALYRAVLAHPEEDTPRLAYADEVEERGDPARAELIRAMCATYAPGRPETIGDSLRHMALVNREFELHAANGERWEPACVACGGHGRHYETERDDFNYPTATISFVVPCNACSGTGRQPCRWERGFPVVQVAAMGQAWRFMGTYHEPPAPVLELWQPTPWLCDAIRTHHVAGVEARGCEPREVRDGSHGFELKFKWYKLTGDDPNARLAQVPIHAVYRLCADFYETRDQALAALSRAIVLAALEWLDAQGAG